MNRTAKQSGDAFRSKARLRSVDELLASCDLYYCLHWAVRQAEIERRPSPAGLVPYIVVGRRRALEWLFCDDSWDSVPMDT